MGLPRNQERNRTVGQRYQYRWDYQEIKKETGLSDRDINTAIGWLAREGKLTIDETKVGRRNVIYIELNYYIG